MEGGEGQISSTTLPQDPDGGAAQITALQEEATAWPLVRPGPQAVSEHQETVGVSAVLVEITPELGAQILPSVPDNLMSIAEEFQVEYGSCSGSMLQEGADIPEGATTVAPPPVVLAAKFPNDVVLPTMAGAAPLADFAEVVAADAAALADAGMPFLADPAGSVTLAVADPAAAGILFPADLAGPVTLAVADSADAGILFLADPAGILFPADPAGILFPADPAGILFPADTARTDTADVAFLADGYLLQGTLYFPKGMGRANVTISEMMNMVIMRICMVDLGHLCMMTCVITVSGMGGVILTMLNNIGPLFTGVSG